MKGKTSPGNHPSKAQNTAYVNQALLLSADDMNRTLRRFAHQFIEPYENHTNLAIIGMQTRGVYIARRIRDILASELSAEVPLGVLDVTFYRDDFRTKMKMPEVKVTEIPFDLDQKDIVLVDDVLYTGRTVRAAMEALMSFGRPRSIKFCCMVDRGHRELPVSADYVGLQVPTHKSEEIRVHLHELDGNDGIYVVQPDDSPANT
ncbi:MAG: pyrimidine operon attenuation protein / uracil phosphoribosyltransferase [Bacteroidetes bacterium HLUCCA01]|nr:MAG: pyrimidine operon attenuation protein / uracil phosphoribosyltransferase [Bacteroidetes bacterium HLUCCA01]